MTAFFIRLIGERIENDINMLLFDTRIDRRAAFSLALLIAFTGLAGCQPKAAPVEEEQEQSEPTLSEQAAAVRDGRGDTIRLDRTLVVDADLVPLDDLHDKLRRVNLSHTEITDEGLARIARCRQLEQLRISSPRVTDAGMAHVAQLSELRFLHLLDMPITDAGLDELHGLARLESLYLDRTKTSDEGLARLIGALPGVHLHVNDHHHPLDPHGKEHAH